jgi:hypothetical protein
VPDLAREIFEGVVGPNDPGGFPYMCGPVCDDRGTVGMIADSLMVIAEASMAGADGS